MRRGALAAAATALALAAPVALAAKPPASPERVQVQGSEYDLVLSRAKLTPGRAIVQFLNAGEDAHDLQMQRLDSSGAQVGAVVGAGEVDPGEYANIDTRLKRGSRYVLWCSLKEHRQLGMEATLRARKHRR